MSSKLTRLFLMAIAVAALWPHSEALARTWHVDFIVAQFNPPDQRDGGESTPFESIAAATRVALPGDVILVQSGNYHENVNLPTGVELRAAHPVRAEGTELDDITQIVISEAPAPAQPGIIVGGDDARTAVIGFQIIEGAAERGAGIFITEGRARIEDNVFFFNEASGASPLGGGIAIFDAPDGDIGDDFHVIIRNNGFVLNTANNAAGTGRGGGIACRANRNQPRVLIEENEFRPPFGGFENNADSGGAVYIEACNGIIRANIFETNLARFGGGGLYCSGVGSGQGADLLIDENLFQNNSAEDGAAAYFSGCQPTINHNTIFDNSARRDGGGMVCNGSSCAFGAVGGRNHFEANTAQRHGGGLAVITNLDGGRIHRAQFIDNEADADQDGEGDGGAIYVYAEVDRAKELPIVGAFDADSLIDGNEAENGGGIAVLGRVTGDGTVNARQIVSLFGYRLSDNQATFGGGIHLGGGAELVLGAGPVLGNVLESNLALASGGAVYVDAHAKLLAFANEIGEPGNNGNLAEDGEGGGVWAHADSQVTAWHNCFYDNEAARGGGFFGGGSTHRLHGNDFYRNGANAGGGAFLQSGPVADLNAIHENSGGGVTCGPGGATTRENRIQANEPYDLDEAACGAGTDNVTGPLRRVRGAYGARFLFPDCGPDEPEGGLDPFPSGDFGDAPDDTAGPFLADYRGDYSAVPGRFPTYADTDNAVDSRLGPAHGLISVLWLGPFTDDDRPAISNDRGAESPNDDDEVPNLDSSIVASDQDAFDDGWTGERLEPCTEQTLEIEVSADALYGTFHDGTAYLNVAADWNHDGSWGGSDGSCGEEAQEWAVQNLAVTPIPGDTIALSLPMLAGSEGDIWLRLVLSEEPITADDDWDGSVLAPFLFGETEDYLVCVGASDEFCAGDPGSSDDAPDSGPDAGEPDPDAGTPDSGGTGPDAGSEDEGGQGSRSGSSGGGGCTVASTPGADAESLAILLLGLVGLVIARRRIQPVGHQAR